MFRKKISHKPYLTNQNLDMTLSAYTLSWYMQKPLSSKLLATRKPHCCVAFFSFPGDNITTGQHMINQSFSNLQFRSLPLSFFHGIHIDLTDTSGEKRPFYLSLSMVLFACLKKPLKFISNFKDGCLKTSGETLL